MTAITQEMNTGSTGKGKAGADPSFLLLFVFQVGT